MAVLESDIRSLFKVIIDLPFYVHWKTTIGLFIILMGSTFAYSWLNNVER